MTSPETRTSHYGLPAPARSVTPRSRSGGLSLLNLSDHPAGALLVSAFVGSAGAELASWCALALVGLAVTVWAFGLARTLVVVGGAHVIATYLSQGVLAVQLEMHHAAAGLVTMSDVGPSYVVVAALAAGVAFGPLWGRLLCLVGLALVGPALFTASARSTSPPSATRRRSRRPCSSATLFVVDWSWQRLSERAGCASPDGGGGSSRGARRLVAT
jgi:hypothetical protein